ncbi:hypothetical protein ACFQ4O_09525 [Methylopila musalis]|uniref:Uncharacterized protein n=1 Tax=Methylopila musalis TaxID=1134781 RepID=A0ABW3Z7J6_9HYPH
MSNRVVAAAGVAAVATYAAVAASLLALPPFVVTTPAVRTAQVETVVAPAAALPVRASGVTGEGPAKQAADGLPPA